MAQAKVDFKYRGTTYTIDCLSTDKMEDVCKKLAEKIGKDLNLLDFLYLDDPLKRELTFEETSKIKKEEPKP